MMSVGNLQTPGGRIVLIGLFAIVLVVCRSIVGGEDPCKDQGCTSHPATGEAAVNGGNCTNPNGFACNSPGASCVTGGTKHCRNFNMGGGLCTCACLAP